MSAPLTAASQASIASIVKEALGILETTGYTPAMVALDAMEKAANVRLVQAELNDFLGYVTKIVGAVGDVRRAIETGRTVAEQMGGKPVATVFDRPDDIAWTGIRSQIEFNPLIQQHIVFEPQAMADQNASSSKSNDEIFALGFIETQGFTAVFEAVDTACKMAGVEVVGKEKLGGGYVTIVLKGDVAAVKAAVEAGKSRVEGLGKLIATHVIPRPSPGVLSLLPKL